VADVAIRRGVTTYSLYQWRKRFGKAPAQQSTELEPHAEIRRSKAEMRQVTEKRFIRKKAAAYFAKG
jgi:transposase